MLTKRNAYVTACYSLLYLILLFAVIKSSEEMLWNLSLYYYVNISLFFDFICFIPIPCLCPCPIFVYVRLSCPISVNVRRSCPLSVYVRRPCPISVYVWRHCPISVSLVFFLYHICCPSSDSVSHTLFTFRINSI